MTKPWHWTAIVVLLLLAATLAFRSCMDSVGRLPGQVASAGPDSIQKTLEIFKEAFHLTPTIVQDSKTVLQQALRLPNLPYSKRRFV